MQELGVERSLTCNAAINIDINDADSNLPDRAKLHFTAINFVPFRARLLTVNSYPPRQRCKQSWVTLFQGIYCYFFSDFFFRVFVPPSDLNPVRGLYIPLWSVGCGYGIMPREFCAVIGEGLPEEEGSPFFLGFGMWVAIGFPWYTTSATPLLKFGDVGHLSDPHRTLSRLNSFPLLSRWMIHLHMANTLNRTLISRLGKYDVRVLRCRMDGVSVKREWCLWRSVLLSVRGIPEMLC